MANPSSNPLTFLSDVEAARAGLPGAGLDWLEQRRANGFERFGALGLPTQKQEQWKYTRLRPLEETTFRPARDADADAVVDVVPSLFPKARNPRLVMVNGRFKPELSNIADLPDGVTLTTLSQALESEPEWVAEHFGHASDDLEEKPLFLLNTALADSGFVLRVARGKAVETPIEVVYIGGLTDEPLAYFPRNLVVLEEGAQATLVKHHVGQGVGPYFANAVTEIEVGNEAILHHYRVQAETVDATHLSTLNVRVGRDATYDAFTLSMGGRLSRTEATVRLEGEGSHCGLNGAYMMRGAEHCDNTTRIEHLVPHTTCREVFKGVLDDEARAVFQGKLLVAKEAQKTDGHQLSKALLLSTGAEIDAKPELEIYADDVKCSHGATTGQLDDVAMFYLRSRGIPEVLARNMLVQSFLGEALEEIADEDVRAAMMDKVVHWLPAHCFLAEEWRKE